MDLSILTDQPFCDTMKIFAPTFQLKSAEAALDYFVAHWDQIGTLAARTAPTNGEVKLRFADLRTD